MESVELWKDWKGWSYLNTLGREFHDELINLYGQGYRNKGGVLAGENWRIELANRSLRRKEICNEIVCRVQPVLYDIANELLTSDVTLLENRIISLKGINNIESGDLVSAASIHLIERFSRYDPVFSMSTFVYLYGAAGMHRYALDHAHLIRIPKRLHGELRRALRNRGVETPMIDEMLDYILPEKPYRSGERIEIARFALLGITGSYQDLFEPLEDRISI